MSVALRVRAMGESWSEARHVVGRTLVIEGPSLVVSGGIIIWRSIGLITRWWERSLVAETCPVGISIRVFRAGIIISDLEIWLWLKSYSFFGDWLLSLIRRQKVAYLRISLISVNKSLKSGRGLLFSSLLTARSNHIIEAIYLSWTEIIFCWFLFDNLEIINIVIRVCSLIIILKTRSI
jgi:hypothetical protein